MSRIYFASDHAGFALKEKLIPFVKELGYEVEDLGPFAFDPRDDYPDFILPAARKISEDPAAFGVILGKSGEGEAEAANRVKGVRAAVFYGGAPAVITLAREHNNANILSLGAGFISEEEAKNAVKLFLETPFSEAPRHARRIQKF